jgi:hypothetical protein
MATSVFDRARGIASLGLCWLTVAAAAAPTPRNYLIVTADVFAGSAPLAQLVAGRTALGFNVTVYPVAAGTTKETIKAYIASLWGTPGAPEFILLVGDTPAVPHWTGGGSKHAPTDLPYACMDAGDDWHPDIAIGRFSVASEAQLQAIVDKTLQVESGNFSDPDYVTRGAFLATNDASALAEQTHDWVITNYFEPRDYVPNRIYAALGGGTQDVTSALNAGSLFLVYFGHSSSGGWFNPGFNQSNINALANAGLYGLAFGFSCNTANYTLDECFGETWIRAANKGTAAYISASTYIYYGGNEWESSRRLEKYFFTSFFVDDIWEVGPAWQAGLYRFLADPDFNDDVKRNMFEMFLVLGDPALRLPQPWGITLTVAPPSQNVCSPPDDQAVYDVAVEPLGGFDETVALSATGLPPGAAAEFNPAGGVPPFAATLTVSGLLNSPPGSYTLSITGTSATAQKSIPAGLNVSAASPAAVTLLDPPDGATAVLRTPLLTWQAAANALSYDLEIATEPGFANPVYTATSLAESHTVAVFLEPLTQYYWHVRGVNDCGAGAFSPPFSFTTLQQSDYFTQLFPGGGNSVDLDNLTLAFRPDGSYDFYTMCAVGITALPTDPTGGTPLTLTDDSNVAVPLTTPVSLYGVSYTTAYVGSNGFITFGGGDNTYAGTYEAHFSRPRVAALFDDLNPGTGGTVSWKELGDRAAVTFLDVPEYGTSNSNTFQVELFHDGEIRISYLAIAVTDALAGLSAGNGVPGDFLETDLSAAPACAWADFAVRATPATLSVCAPASAVYTVFVDQNLGYTDPVTLSAAGYPAGASVAFSANGLPPPYTSVMTIANTGAAAPGNYPVTITGVSPDYQRTASVALNLATTTPPPVQPQSPPNGATGVDRQPTLTWEPADQAAAYDLEIAEDDAFTIIRYAATVSQTSHPVGVSLDLGRLYYWHVRAVNACGVGAYGPAYSFTTVDLPEYFTELFIPPGDSFDLDNLSLTFTPVGGADFYSFCGEPITALPTDPTGGNTLVLPDDGNVQVTPSASVALFGVSYAAFFVNSNGNITFNGGDNTYSESLAAHFSRPRIAAVYDDLNPATGGTVSYKETPGRIAVTWLNVPEYGTSNANTFQIELFFDGTLRVSWLQIAVTDGLAGLSRGTGQPGDFQESDLSAARPCVNAGDLDCDGDVDFDDINPFVLALSDPAGYHAAYPDCNILNADCDGDGDVDFNDINAFVALLSQ